MCVVWCPLERVWRVMCAVYCVICCVLFVVFVIPCVLCGVWCVSGVVWFVMRGLCFVVFVAHCVMCGPARYLTGELPEAGTDHIDRSWCPKGSECQGERLRERFNRQVMGDDRAPAATLLPRPVVQQGSVGCLHVQIRQPGHSGRRRGPTRLSVVLFADTSSPHSRKRIGEVGQGDRRDGADRGGRDG